MISSQSSGSARTTPRAGRWGRSAFGRSARQGSSSRARVSESTTSASSTVAPWPTLGRPLRTWMAESRWGRVSGSPW
eukprot:10764151-Lingulodinium_polyedra.AAC.1